MSVIERTFTVSYCHRVLFSRGAFNPENQTVCGLMSEGSPAGRAKALVVVDDGLQRRQPGVIDRIVQYFAAHANKLHLVSAPLIAEGGERVKNSYFHVSEIHSAIDRYHIDRHGFVLAIGGGAMLDMVGLAAATAHRGVRLIRLPTTTLSQDDSGVGVKNGINGFGKKNFVGTFAPPFAVVNDFDFLVSLPDRDKRAGFAEAVKVALIRNREWFEVIERQADELRRFDPSAMEMLIKRCAELHVDHIATSGDPFEFGSSRPLDFGHWSAHKIEQLSSYRIRHGEAVAMGIALDTIYSGQVGLLGAPVVDRVLRLLRKLEFDLYANELSYTGPDGTHKVLEGLEEFREHLGGRLTITLLEDIGRGVEVHDLKPSLVLQAIGRLRRWHEKHRIE